MKLNSAVGTSASHSFTLTRRYASASPEGRGEKLPSPFGRGQGEGARRSLAWVSTILWRFN